MKKYINIIFITIFVFGLCVCSKFIINRTYHYNTETSSIDSFNITRLTAGTGYFATPQFCTNSGVYTISLINGNCNILYSDFDSKSLIYLCSSSNCNHLDENCTSFIPASGFIFGDNIDLYYISDNFSNVKGEYKQIIYSMDLSGNNKQTFYEFKPYEIYNGSHIFSDGTNLYTIIENTNDSCNYIAKISKNSCKYLLKTNYSDVLVSSENSKLFIKRDIEYDRSKYFYAPQFEIISFDIQSGDIKQVYLSHFLDCEIIQRGDNSIYKPIGDTAYSFKNNIMYHLNRNDMLLSTINLLTNEKSIISDLSNVLANWDSFSIEEINNDYCIINFMYPDADRYIISLKDGAYYQNKLKSYSMKSSSEFLLDPIFMTNDKIIFYNGGTTYDETFELPDGTYEKHKISFAAMNFIDIQDYIKNIDNYVNIDFSNIHLY